MESLLVFEYGFAYLLIYVILAEQIDDTKTSGISIVALLCFAILIIDPGSIWHIEGGKPMNLSAHILPLPVMLGLLLVIERINPADTIELAWICVVSALIVSALISFKNQLVPFALLFFTFALFINKYISYKQRAIIFLLSIMFVIAVLLPWLLLAKSSSGTYLWPLTGAGWHGMNWGLMPRIDLRAYGAAEWMRILIRMITNPYFIVLGMLLTASCFSQDRRTRIVIAGIFGLGLTGLCALVYASNAGQRPIVIAAWEDDFRFVYAPVVAGIGWLSLRIYKTVPILIQGIDVRVMTCLFCMALLIGDGFSHSIKRLYLFARISLGKPVFLPYDATFDESFAEINNVLAGLDEDAKVIIMNGALKRPYRLDFAKADYYIMDMPCALSLPPGMPCNQDAQAIFKYFVNNGICHVLINNHRIEDESIQPRKMSHGISDPAYGRNWGAYIQEVRNAIVMADAPDYVSIGEVKLISLCGKVND